MREFKIIVERTSEGFTVSYEYVSEWGGAGGDGLMDFSTFEEAIKHASGCYVPLARQLIEEGL